MGTVAPPDPRVSAHDLRPLKMRRFDLNAGIPYVLAWLQDERFPPCRWETQDTSLRLVLSTDAPSRGPDGRSIVHVNGTYRVFGHAPRTEHLPGEIDRTLDGIAVPALVTLFLRPRGPEQVGIEAIWDDNGLDLVPMIVRRLTDQWTILTDSADAKADTQKDSAGFEPAPLHMVRPYESELCDIAQEIRRMRSAGFPPASIQQEAVLRRQTHWVKKTLERTLKKYLQANGLPAGRGQWRIFVDHVLENSDRFRV
jgi:hypothetical protein